MKTIYRKYKELILYLLFGSVISVVCLGSHWIAAEKMGLSTTASYVISWLLAAILAFLSNKFFVFERGQGSPKQAALEAATFFCCRLFTGILGGAFTVLTVDKLHFPEMVMRFLGSVIEVVLNYFLSKLLVFRKKSGK